LDTTARASRARSLAASRKVGASIVVEAAVVATGYNDVPYGQIPDVRQGIDTSEKFKRDNLRDTMQRLKTAGLLADGLDGDGVDQAVAALKGGELISVIEDQRAVHAEARAIDDATEIGGRPGLLVSHRLLWLSSASNGCGQTPSPRASPRPAKGQHLGRCHSPWTLG
jgi:deoxycytidylate deaminase